ncbi:hypothetical protein MQE23_06360 [Streptomyces sp. HP-A2021]|uniref:hypothetical protein n=1 Tax=Streptomyces sp. HP-A2021 TaxID=2927875 RepID=UPI001FAE8EEB|nr:hypothetical protein [Streptomyces sp. HP-A2021]UOB08703.1 hypothetical protein MQE23_06360 [Streptomyces sp. HP-A2021]
MKLTYLRFEGTPEELDASEVVRELVQQLPGTVDTARPTPRVVADPDSDDVVDFGWQVEGDVPGVADEGQETVKAQLAFNPAAQQFIDFMAEAGSWESVGVHGIKRKTWQEGDPLDYSGYLRLRRKGSQFGGFAYAFASTGVVNFRLLHSDEIAELAPDAYPLATGHRRYRVNIQIRDENTLKQALALAELAYDAT